MSQLFASQPIYDRHNIIYAHELLYRNDSGFTAFDVGEDMATTELIYNLCTGIAEHVEHFKQPVCINVSAEFLLSKAFLPINPEFVIIELVERIVPSPEIIRAVRAWVDAGFRFALDDFEFLSAWRPLLEMATIVKVDIEQITLAETSKRYRQLTHLDILWLAERIEDEHSYHAFRNLGFDLFQGFYLAKPKIIEGTKLPSGAIEYSRIIDKLFQHEPDVEELAAALKADPTLLMNLLRIANSPYYGSRRKIESVKEVIMLIGIEPLRKWVLLITALQHCEAEQARIVLTRAFMCSDLAHENLHSEYANKAFLAGLLAGSDVLLGVNKAAFVSQLNVADEILQAVVNYQGKLGELLQRIERFEYDLAMKKATPQDFSALSSFKKSSFQVQLMFNSMQPE